MNNEFMEKSNEFNIQAETFRSGEKYVTAESG